MYMRSPSESQILGYLHEVFFKLSACFLCTYFYLRFLGYVFIFFANELKATFSGSNRQELRAFSPGSASLIPYFSYSALNSLNAKLNVLKCWFQVLHTLHTVITYITQPGSLSPGTLSIPIHRLWSLGILSLWSLIPLFWFQILLLSRISDHTLITNLTGSTAKKNFCCLFLSRYKNLIHIAGAHGQWMSVCLTLSALDQL